MKFKKRVYYRIFYFLKSVHLSSIKLVEKGSGAIGSNEPSNILNLSLLNTSKNIFYRLGKI